MDGTATKSLCATRSRRAPLGRVLGSGILAVVFWAGEARGGDIAGQAVPGGLVRWAGPSLLSCELGKRAWAPLDDACWYPIDLEAEGELELVRRSTGGVASRRVRVGPYPYSTQRLTVDDKYVTPPPETRERIERERRRTEAIFELETERRFTLPLAAPLARLPKGGRFGARRFFNGVARAPHSGADYAVATGTPVLAAAPGRVVLAEELYFAGKAVYLDHGDGLISMSFHLSEIFVAEGDEVNVGTLLGKVGATGRVTGAHLHFGLRWHGARVDPVLLFGDGSGIVDLRPFPTKPVL